jgi:Galactose oxidase, central domain
MPSELAIPVLSAGRGPRVSWYRRLDKRIGVARRLRTAAMLTRARLSAAKSGWIPTGYLSEARLAHTATLLADGRVLVAGGQDFKRVLSSAEIYDPQTARWTTTGAMHTARYLHTSTLLADGTVLVAGGFGSLGIPTPTLASAERYDPTTGTWSSIAPMHEHRAWHTATPLPNRRILIADGLVYVAGERFDPATGQWTGIAVGQARYAATATLLVGGWLLLYGGQRTDGDTFEYPQNTADTYQPLLEILGSPLGIATQRAWHTATQLTVDDTVLFVGGGTRILSEGGDTFTYADTPIEERYRITIGRTYPLANNMRERRHSHTATLLADGSVLVAGGNYFTGTSGPRNGPAPLASRASTERYFPLPVGPDETVASGAWTDAGRLSDARGVHTATLLADGTVLVAGGADFGAGWALDSADRFYPELSDLGGCGLILAALAAGGVALAHWC